MRPLSDIDAAYLAGLIDGEGCLAVVREKSKTCRGGFAYRAKLHVANSNKAIMVWLQKALGVGWLKHHQPIMRNSKPQWGWEISGSEAAAIAGRLLPYLKIKAPQAKLIIALQKLKAKNGRGRPIAAGDRGSRERMYHKSRGLNQRGRLPYVAPAEGAP